MSGPAATQTCTTVGRTAGVPGGEYFCYCGCGWTETGWKTELGARLSLNQHVATAHRPSAAVSQSHT